jgi:hypothetical protein
VPAKRQREETETAHRAIVLWRGPRAFAAPCGNRM